MATADLNLGTLQEVIADFLCRPTRDVMAIPECSLNKPDVYLIFAIGEEAGLKHWRRFKSNALEVIQDIEEILWALRKLIVVIEKIMRTTLAFVGLWAV